MAYIIMFITAFSSATLIPMGSEAVLLYHITQGHNLYFLFATAVVANTLGSYVNYYLGYKGEEYLIRKKYLRENKIKKHKKTFGKYGGLALLLAWVPIIGDGLTFVAGILQYSVKKFLFLYLYLNFLDI